MLRTSKKLGAAAWVVAALLASYVHAQNIETVVFFDDFESADPVGTILPDSPPIGDNWLKYNSNSTDSFIANNPESEIRNTSPLSYSTARPDPPTPGVGVALMIAPIAQVHRDLITANGNAKISLKYYDTGQQYSLSFLANNATPGTVPTGSQITGLSFNGGNITQSGFGASNLTYSLNDWHDIELDLDFGAQQYMLSVDGVAGSQPIPFQDSGRTTLSNLWFGHVFRPSHYFIDDVRVSTTGPAPPTLKEWVSAGSGQWNNLTNWSPAFVPNATDDEVLFGSAITAPRTVVVDTDVTVNSVEFNNANTYAVAGTGRITLAGTAPQIVATSGNHQFQAKIDLDADTTADGSGGAIDFNNRIDLAGNSLNTAGAVNINHSVISSSGVGSIVNTGTLGTAGTTPIAADLTSTGALAVDISGTGIGQTDLFSITGAANLEGAVNVAVLGGFVPASDITILSATGGINLTGAISLSGPGAGLFSGVSVMGNNLVLNVGAAAPSGDYNGNGVVDAADYVLWRKTLNQNVAPGTEADGDGSGTIDAGDYAYWSARYGSAVGSGAAAAIPEPTAILLLMLGAAGGCLARRSR